jgi:hypothetical protein
LPFLIALRIETLCRPVSLPAPASEMQLTLLMGAAYRCWVAMWAAEHGNGYRSVKKSHDTQACFLGRSFAQHATTMFLPHFVGEAHSRNLSTRLVFVMSLHWHCPTARGKNGFQTGNISSWRGSLYDNQSIGPGGELVDAVCPGAAPYLIVQKIKHFRARISCAIQPHPTPY